MRIFINFAEQIKNSTDMFTNEDYERLLVRYTTEGVPAGESIQHFCDRNKVPYNLFNKWYRDTRHKVVRVEVDGKPKDGDASLMDAIVEEAASRPMRTERDSRQPAPVSHDKDKGGQSLIMVDLRTTQGLQIRKKGMTYPQFLEFAQNLASLC